MLAAGGELAEAPGAAAAGGLRWAGMLIGGHRPSGATYFLGLWGFDAAVDEATHVILSLPLDPSRSTSVDPVR